jgi:hypothetical protein
MARACHEIAGACAIAQRTGDRWADPPDDPQPPRDAGADRLAVRARRSAIAGAELRTRRFEERYRRIDTLRAAVGATRVLEIASGLSRTSTLVTTPRRIELAKRRLAQPIAKCYSIAEVFSGMGAVGAVRHERAARAARKLSLPRSVEVL